MHTPKALKLPLCVAIDGNEANVAQRVGSNVYAFEVLNALYQLPVVKSNWQVTVLLSQPPISDLPPVRPGWRYRVLTPKPLWTQLALPLHLWLQTHSYDILFTPGHYAPRWLPIPYVSSVMDVAFLCYPEQFKPSDLLQLRDWTAYSVKRAKKVIAISSSTQQAVSDVYGRELADVVVAYPALSPLEPDLSLNQQRSFSKKHGLAEEYFVYVGTLQPRKNLVKLIESFTIVCDRLKTMKPGRRKKIPQLPQLVIAGKVGWLAEGILAAVKNSPYVERIVLTGYVTEAEKQFLLKNARASVLVGLYEGFGIPPLESLRLGTVPVVSQTTSLPEVVGEAGILVDPENVESIAAGLTTAWTLSTQERARLRKLGREQFRKFSWSKTAETIAAVLQ